MPICLRLFEHRVRRDASRAAWTAGNKSATSTPMMAMTTNSSTSVKPDRRREDIAGLLLAKQICQHVANQDSLLFRDHIEIELEGTFFFHLDRVFALAVPFGRHFGFGRRRE